MEIYLLQSAVIAVAAATLIHSMLRYIETRPDLLTDQGSPPNLCGGGWREAQIRNCERGYAITGVPVEPVGTYSCVMYPAAAWVTLQSIGGGPAVVFFIIMTFLCFGSAVYHGIKTQWAGKLDDASMYAVFASLSMYAMLIGHSWEVWMMAVAAILAAVILTYVVGGYYLGYLGILLAFIWAGIFTGGDAKLGLYGIILFALAMTAWQIDRRSGLLDRFGHGIWHVLTALAITMTFAAIG